ncbi:dihydrofolate reductase-like domain-containing protein [Lentinula edodes]|nr:dihydrofolate reductase-like domain-containing protein [Lentinula edodes]
MAGPPVFLSSLLNRYNPSIEQSTPFVTLTFAQSLDAKIAGKGGKQLILSGKESMVMTHWMRTMHDGILIGIGTALNDDPQLNTRHLPSQGPDPSVNGHNNSYNLPRPMILDTKLRLNPHCKLLKNYAAGEGRRPWLICAEPSQTSERTEWLTRRNTLEKAGARMVVLETNQDTEGYLPISLVLQTVFKLGIRSVMVEGGAQVIRSFFSPQNDTHPTGSLVDTAIITVAPIFVGEDGVSYNVETGLVGVLKIYIMSPVNLPRGLEQSTSFKYASTAMFGQDTVVGLIAA